MYSLTLAIPGAYNARSHRGEAGSLGPLVSFLGYVRTMCIPSKTAANSLEPPTMGILDATSFEELIGRV
jgi:hypothetical protein